MGSSCWNISAILLICEASKPEKWGVNERSGMSVWVSGWNKPWYSNAGSQGQCCSGWEKAAWVSLFCGRPNSLYLEIFIISWQLSPSAAIGADVFQWNQLLTCIAFLASCPAVFWPHQGPIPAVATFCVSHQRDANLPYYHKQSLFYSFQEVLMVSQEMWFGQTAGFCCLQNFHFWRIEALPPVISLTWT